MKAIFPQMSSLTFGNTFAGLFASRVLAFLVSMSLIAHPSPLLAQTETALQTAIQRGASVPQLVRFNGILIDGTGWPITTPTTVTFAIYAQPTGGDTAPLWQEKQQISPNSKGSYSVLLGSGSPGGIPIGTFQSGESQYLSVTAEGEPEQARVLLVSVPYAMKAGDAATLGGLPASAYALAGTRSTANAAMATPAVSPVAADVTTTGGAAGYVPEFSGASAIVDSPLFVNGANVGIGTTAPGATLDVAGTMLAEDGLTVNTSATFNAPLLFTPTGTATATKDYPSQYIKIETSAYNSSTSSVVAPRFQWQAEVQGNDTASPTTTLTLSSSTTNAAPVQTGFSFNANGTINFSPKQTFPASTFTGEVSASSTTGGGDAIAGTSTAVLGTGVSGTGAGPGGYGVTGIANGDGNPGFTPVGVLGYSVPGYGVSATTSTGIALYSEAQTTGQAGYFTSAFGGPMTEENVAPVDSASVAIYNTYDAVNAGGNWNGTTPQGLYVESDGYNATGILATATNGGIGIWGLNGDGSNTASFLRSYVAAAGVWGDTVAGFDGSPGFYGVVGTTDNNSAAYFENNSTDYTTLQLYNIAPSGGAGTGMFKTLQASTVDGTCGFGGKGNLTCTGQVKTLATTSKSRMVETYAMQSPENWMEDFGSATLTNGVATVAIDPAFAETVSASADYHVFLTPNGDSKGLYVTAKSATSFEVHESGGGASTLAFDYRIVAKRLGHESERLVDVTDRFHAETAETTKHLQAAANSHLAGVRRTARPASLALPAPRIPETQSPVQPTVMTAPANGAGLQ